MNNLLKRKKELKITYSEDDEYYEGYLDGMKFAEDEILKMIKDCSFDKNNIAIKEFKEVIEKQIKGEK